jgi:hypothetical protein
MTASIEAALSNTANHLRLPLDAVQWFVRRARAVDSRLTERGCCVLLVVSRCPGIPMEELVAALVWPRAMLVAVLQGLAADLRLVDVHRDVEKQWLRRVHLSVAGLALVAGFAELAGLE